MYFVRVYYIIKNDVFVAAVRIGSITQGVSTSERAWNIAVAETKKK